MSDCERFVSVGIQGPGGPPGPDTAAAIAAFVATLTTETSRAEAAESTLAAAAAAAQATANAAMPNTNAAINSLFTSWFNSLPTNLSGGVGSFANIGGTLQQVQS